MLAGTDGRQFSRARVGGKSGLHRAGCWLTARHERAVRRKAHRGERDGKCNREETAAKAVRVKRRCKRPPGARRRASHGKPHPEQDQIGDRFGPARSGDAGAAIAAAESAIPGKIARGARRRASQRNGRHGILARFRRDETMTEPGLQSLRAEILTSKNLILL